MGGATPVRSVSTQCSLPPASQQQGGPPPGTEPGLDSPTLGCTTAKPDKLDFVGFLQRVRG